MTILNTVSLLVISRLRSDRFYVIRMRKWVFVLGREGDTVLALSISDFVRDKRTWDDGLDGHCEIVEDACGEVRIPWSDIEADN